MNRCALCPGVNKCIGPDGPDDAEMLCVGEAPGRKEQDKGRVFVGPTGEETNRHYLPLAGLSRHSVRVTNAIRCLPTTAGGKLKGDDPKHHALLHSCAAAHLYPLIERTPPKLIVPLGTFACRAICPDVDLELQHGMPVETAWGIPAFPMYHPALGLHEPKKMLYIRTDWQRLRQYLKGTLRLPVDDYEPDYREVTDAREIQELDPDRVVAVDTESTRHRDPFCLTYSQQAGEGRLIRAGRSDLIRAWGERAERGRGPILFHNWLYDWAVTEKMELSIQPQRVVDTMARVFQLGNLPQGLKALALRELGMEMQDFDDLVTPYSRQNVLTYYQIAATMEWERPAEELVQDSKTGLWKLYKPQSMKTKLKRFFTDYSKNPEKNVFEMFEDNWVNEQAMLEERCGPYPGKCITHVPFEKVLHYACRDADALIRLWPVIERMSKVVRRVPQERWRDAA